MSDAYLLDADVLTAGLSDAASVQRLAGLLRDDASAENRAEIANAFVGMAGREPHPRAKAALLDRAAALVEDSDRERSALLLRESMRILPTAQTASRLFGLVDAEPSLSRLGRIRNVIDSAAVLSEAEEGADAWRTAAHRHLEIGEGAAALRCLDLAIQLGGEREDDAGFRETAQAQRDARDEALASVRETIAASTSDDVADALVDYAELLVVGDAAASDVAAVLADAADAGAPPGRIAPLWAEAARAAAQPEQLARALAALLALEQPPHLRVRIADELANLPSVDTLAPAALIVALNALTEALPDDLALRARLLGTRAMAGEEDAEPALELLRGEAVRSRDRAAEALAALALGRIAMARGDEERVDRMLRRVRTLEPDNTFALDHFEARYRAGGEHERLYVLLGTRLNSAAPDVALRIAVDMAELAEGPLASPERAAEAWHRVLAIAPDHEAALEALARVERESGDVLLLTDLLQRRARVLQARLDADPAMDRAALRDVLLELATLSDRDGDLPDPGIYIDAMGRLAKVAYDDDAIADMAASALVRAGRRTEATALWLRAADATSDARRRRSLAAQLLRHCESFPSDGDHVAAERACAWLLDDADADATDLEAVASTLRRIGPARSLLQAIARLRSLGDTEALRNEATELALATGDQDAALQLQLDAIASAPGEIAPRLRACAMLRAMGKTREAADLAQAGLPADHASASDRADLLEAAVSARLELGEGDDELRPALEALVALRPDSSVASEAGLRSAIARRDVDAALQQAALRGMDGLALREHLVELADGCDDRGAADRLLLAGELAARDGSHDAAVGLGNASLARAQAAGDAARIAAAAAVVADAAEQCGEIEIALAALDAWADIADAAEQPQLQARIAKAAEAGRDFERAWTALTALSERLGEPNAGAAGIGAADLAAAIVRVAEELALPGLAVELLAERADAARERGDGATCRALLEPAATLALATGESLDTASAAWARSVAQGDAGIEGWQKAEQLAEAAGDWQAALRAIEAIAALLDGDEAANALLRAATLADGAANDRDRAVTLWRRALQLRPGARSAWLGLLEATRARNDEAALASLLGELLASPVQDLELLCAAFVERASLMGPNDDAALLDAAERPLSMLAQEATLSPAGEDVLAIVAGRLDVEAVAARASALILPVARKHSRLDEMARAMECADAATDTEGRITQLVDLAALHDGQLGDGSRALDALRAALLLAPTRDELWQRAEAIAARHQLGARVDSLVASLAGVSDEDPEAVAAGANADRGELLRRMAKRAEATGREDAAAQAWQSLSQLRPDDLTPLEALEGIWRSARDFDALAHVLERRLALPTEADEAALVWLRLVEAHRDGRGDGAAASAVLKRATDALPGSEALWATRIDHLADIGDESGLIAALQQQIALLTTAEAAEGPDAESRVERLVASLRRLAPLDARHDAALGLRHITALLELDPADDAAATFAFELLDAGDRETIAKLVDIFAARGDLDRQDLALERLVALSDGGAQRTTLRLQQADLRLAGLGRPLAALEALTDALGQRPGDGAIVDRIAALVGEDERHVAAEAAAGSLLIALDAATVQAERLALLERARELFVRAGAEDAAIDLAGRIAAESGDDEAFDRWLGGMIAQDRADEAVDALLQRADGRPEDASDAARADRRRAARVAEQAGKSQRALAIWIEELASAGDDEAFDAVARIGAADPAGEAALLAAADAAGDEATKAARLRTLAERAVDAQRTDAALTALDHLLTFAAADDDAWAMREALLDGLGAAGRQRLQDHRRQALAAAADGPLAHDRLLALAFDLQETGDARGAFALIAGAIETSRPGTSRDDLIDFAVSIAEDAGMMLDAAALLAVTAKVDDATSPALAGQRLLRAARLAAHDHADRARAWAADALATARQGDEAGDAGTAAADVAADAAALLLALHGQQLPDLALGEAMADALSARDAAIALQLRLQLAESADGAEGVRLWQAVFDHAPAGSAEAGEALRRLAAAEPGVEARWQALAAHLGEDRRDEQLEVLLTASELATDPDLRADLLVRAATIAEASGDAESAAGWLRIALELRPDEALRARLHGILESSGQNSLLAETLLQEAQRSEGQARTDALRQALALYQDAGNERGTLHALRALADAGALSEAEELPFRRGEWLAGTEGAAEAILARWTSLADARRSDWASLVAGVHLAADRVVEALAVAQEVDAAHARADASFVPVWLGLVDRAHEVQEAHALQILVGAMERLDPTTEPAAWASAALQLASTSDDDQQRLQVLDQLVAHADGPLADSGLALDWACRAVAQSGGDRPRIDALLERIEGSDGDIGAAAATIGSALADGSADDGRDAARAARAVARLGADGDIIDAVTLRADDAAFAIAALAGLAGQLRAAGATALAQQLERTAIAHAGPDDGVAVAHALCAAASEDASTLDDAFAAWMAVAHEAAALDLLAPLRDAARAADRVDAWVDAAEAVIGREDLPLPVLRVVVGLTVETALDDLGDPARAADASSHVWDALPGDEDARDTVLALRRAAGDDRRLRTDLDRAVMAGGAGVGPLRVELAALLANDPNQVRSAIALLRTQLDEQPDDAAASEALERLAGQPKVGADALDALVRCYRRRGDDRALVEALSRWIQAKGDAAATDALRELSEVQLRLGESRAASATAMRAADVSHSADGAELLVEASCGSGDDAIAKAFGALREMELAPERRATLLERLLGALSERDATWDLRESMLRAWIDAAPTRDDVWAQLDARLEAGGRWPELLQLRRARLEHLSDEGERISALHELAGVAGATGVIGEAIAAYRELGWMLEDDPAPWIALAELLENDDHHAERAEALVAVGSRTQGEQKVRALCEAARIQLSRLDDRTAASSSYAEAFNEDPANDEAFVFLDKARHDDPAALADLYARRSEAMKPGPSRVVVLRKLAHARTELGDATGARAALTAALLEAPESEPLAIELLDLAEDAGDWPAFATAAKMRLQRPLPKPERLLLVRKLARMAVDHDDQAEHWLSELEKLAPGDPEATSLRGMIAAASDDPETAAAGLESLIRTSDDSVRKVRLLARLVSLYSDRLQQPTKAISALQRLLRLDPKRNDAHARLAELYHSRGSHEALAEALRHWLLVLDKGAPARGEVALRLGALLLELGRDGEAVEPLETAAAEDPHDAKTLSALALLRTRQGRLAEAADLQVRVVERLKRTGQREDLPASSRRAGTLLERVGRFEEAVVHYQAALAADGSDVESLLGHGRSCLATGDVSRAIADMEKVARMPATAATARQRAEAAVGLGHCWRRQGKKAQALASFNQALEFEPGFAAALEALSGN